MQGFPQANVPMTGTAAVPPVPTPARPTGVTPNMTQYPTVPVNPFQMAPYGTYSGAQSPFMPSPAPSVFPTPGPSGFGPAPGAGAAGLGTGGGVGGVSMVPVTGVVPPAVTGGPHPLPGLPQLPLPQGFPNPFALQQVTPGPAPQQAAPSYLGTVLSTGPQGYMPGLGYFGAQPGVPSMQAAPGPSFQGPSFQVPPPPAFAPAPQAPVYTRPQPQPQPQPQPADSFWQNLAWQLLQTPVVRSMMGDRFAALVEGQDRMLTLQIASACLTTEELQKSFRLLTSGSMDQSRFIETFTDSVKRSLQATGLLPST